MVALELGLCVLKLYKATHTATPPFLWLAQRFLSIHVLLILMTLMRRRMNVIVVLMIVMMMVVVEMMMMTR